MSTPSVLVYGDGRTPELRHEVPLPISEPTAYVEHEGKRLVFAQSMDVSMVEAVDGLDVAAFEEFGLDDFLAGGSTLEEATQEALARACDSIGLTAAITPRSFPLELADFLRGRGLELRGEGRYFEARRRAKSPAELAGIRRAQRAAEAAVAAVRARLQSGEAADSAELRTAVHRVLAGCAAIPHDGLIIACGPDGADPHAAGEGPIEPSQPTIVDIFPRDLESGCWGDLTRTICAGEPSEKLRQYHADVLEAVQRATAAVRPGVTGEELHRIAAGVLAERGHPIRIGQPKGQVLAEGFVHNLGHGVGLELHEEPTLDEGCGPLLVGDVITIEPGVYYKGWGGVRIEDLVLVTEDGYELITDCPYDL